MDRPIRRLAAIVAADVVGYSRKIEADESSTLAALKDLLNATITPLLAENKGRMIKTMGDGFIAEFGSVVDAVTFAVAMQKAVLERQSGTAIERRLVFRVGINLGDVVVEGDDLLGDGVNIAARLEQLSTPGGIMISGTAYDQLQGKLGLPLDFTGEQQVKNISRPVRTYAVRLDGSGPGWRRTLPRFFKRTRPAIAAGLAAAILAGGAWQFTHRNSLPANPSIAVLPFEVVGGDAASDRLAKGLAKDISSDLSRLRDIDIVTISATDAKDADARGVAKAMHVRYLVSGSIQREGDAARVTAQLVDGGTGASLWSRRWDRPIADIFAIQNEVADGVIATLGDRGQLVNLTAAAARHKRPSDLEAYDLYAMGIAAKHKGGTKENLEEALKYEDAAVAQDPQFALAKVQKGWTIMFLAWDFQRDMGQSLGEAQKLAKQAVEIDSNDAQAHILLGTVLLFSGDNAGARVEIDRALQLNPSSADILDVSAGAMSYFGNPEQGAAMCDRAFRLNSSPPDWYAGGCVQNYFFTERYQDSVNMSKRWIAYMPKGIWANNFAWLAAAQSQLGAAEDAAATIAEWKRVFPDLGAEVVLGYPQTFDRPIEADKFLAALQKANAPICVASDKLNSLPDMKRLALCDAQRAKEATR
jgi:class 3 adenylate cyclase/TolB-like protein/tetratricopeptide (TPR) repeat protein